MVERVITIMGARVHYWVHNPKAKKVIVAVHGFRGNHKALVEFSEAINDYQVIMFDLPGYGQSSPMDVPHTIENYALFIKEFAQALSLPPFVLWGHSFGGSICLYYVAHHHHAVRRLVLVSPAIVTTGLLERIGTQYYKVATHLPKKMQRSWLASRLFDRVSGELLIKNVSPERKKKLIDAGKENLKETRPQVLLESYLSYYELDFLNIAPAVTVPTLVIAGQLDTLVPLEALENLTKQLPDAQLEIITDHGHLSPLEIPETVAELSVDFMKQATLRTQSLASRE